jgi:ResB-like family
MIFAKYAPIRHVNDSPTGLSIGLSEDGSKVTILSPEGSGATYLRSEIMNKPVVEADALIILANYWPDFAMKNGQPVTVSDAPNNPAALVHISQLESPKTAKPSLEFAPADNGIVYQLRRGAQVIATGSAKPGDSFALGWADWHAELVQFLPKAELFTEIKPGPLLPQGRQGIPGFRAHLETAEGKRGSDQWVESGQIVGLTAGTQTVRIGYGLETKPLPFSLRLVDFKVPRDEGTDTPSDFMATIEFRDSVSGEAKTGTAKMNHPASFPGTPLANLTGLTYKFSQAEWNPANLGQTTLQVLYDPGWLLKWIGSLSICVGIAIMFYWTPGGRSSNPPKPPEGSE